MAEKPLDPEEARGEDPGGTSSPTAVADRTETLVADLPTIESIPITIPRSDDVRSLDDYVAITRNPQEAEVYSATLSSLLDELGAFSSAVFAPLLAFVLGYYFGEKQQR